MSEEPMDWTICGRVVGKSSGWDQSDTFAIQLYNFVGTPGYKGPIGECVTFHFERGLIETVDENGNIVESVDLIDAISACPVNRC